MPSPRQRTILLTAVVGLAVLGMFGAYEFKSGTAYRTYNSPSGEYRLVVHRYSRLLTVPGDSSSAPGYVELFNRKGQRLAKSDLPTVLDLSLEENVHWYDDMVSVPGMFAFHLDKAP